MEVRQVLVSVRQLTTPLLIAVIVNPATLPVSLVREGQLLSVTRARELLFYLEERWGPVTVQVLISLLLILVTVYHATVPVSPVKDLD